MESTFNDLSTFNWEANPNETDFFLQRSWWKCFHLDPPLLQCREKALGVILVSNNSRPQGYPTLRARDLGPQERRQY